MKTGTVLVPSFLLLIVLICAGATVKKSSAVSPASEKPYEIIFKSPEIIKFSVREIKSDVTATGGVVINSKYNLSTPKFSNKPTRLNEIAQQRSDNAIEPSLTTKATITNNGTDHNYRIPEDDLSQSRNAAKTIALSNYSVVTGNFTNVFKRATDKVSTTDFQGVTFPFRINMMFENYSAEILITKPGNWTIDANISSE